MEVDPDDWRSPLALLINKGACGCCHGEQGDLREKEEKGKKEKEVTNMLAFTPSHLLELLWWVASLSWTQQLSTWVSLTVKVSS